MDRKAITATAFSRNFGKYRMEAQRAPVPISAHGEVMGFFVSKDDYEALLAAALKQQVFLTSQADDAFKRLIASSRMDSRHDHLNALLDDDNETK